MVFVVGVALGGDGFAGGEDKGSDEGEKGEDDGGAFHNLDFFEVGGGVGDRVAVFQRGIDEAGEEGMRGAELAEKFGVELAGEIIGVVVDFDHLYEIDIGRDGTDSEAGFFELFAVAVVYLVAVAVALRNGGGFVEFVGFCIRADVRDAGAKAHGAANISDAFLLFLEADDGVRGGGDELGAIGLFEAGDVAGEFYNGYLHPEADAEEGDFLLARILCGEDFAFDPAIAEAAGDEDAVHAFEVASSAVFFDGFRIDTLNGNPRIAGGTGVGERFVDGFVGVLELDVFADDCDADAVAGIDDTGDVGAPLCHVRLLSLDAEAVAHVVIEPLLAEHEGRFVDGIGRVGEFDYRGFRNVAVEGDFIADVVVERVFGAADDDVGLDTDFAEFCDGLLGRFTLQFTCGLDVGDESDVDENSVFATDVLDELSERFEEGLAFDVTYGAADLGDDDVASLGGGDVFNAVLDFVGDVGDHLDGFAEVVAAAFFFEDCLVDLAGGEVVVAGEDAVGEALVVAEVEVGLGSVVEHVNFTVLKRAHRAGIDIEIRIEFLKDDFLATRLEEGAKRGSSEAFAEGADDATGDEYVFHIWRGKVKK